MKLRLLNSFQYISRKYTSNYNNNIKYINNRNIIKKTIYKSNTNSNSNIDSNNDNSNNDKKLCKRKMALVISYNGSNYLG